MREPRDDVSALVRRGDELRDMAVLLAEQVPVEAWDNVDWIGEDEDPLRELVDAAARYSAWRDTGHYTFLETAPGWDEASAFRHFRETGSFAGYSEAWVPMRDAATALVTNLRWAVGKGLGWFDRDVNNAMLDGAVRSRVNEALREGGRTDE